MREQYLAIDFLHNDFEIASACADMLAGGALQYAIARSHTIAGEPAPVVDNQYLLERRTLDADPERRLTLVANIAFKGDALNPVSLQKEITRIGAETGQKDIWNFGTKIRAAKLFAYGTDILSRMNKSGMDELSLAVWPDAGAVEKKHKVPRQHLGQSFFSLNTSRSEPHWIGHVNGWSLQECAANNNHLALDLGSLNVLTLRRR